LELNSLELAVEKVDAICDPDFFGGTVCGHCASEPTASGARVALVKPEFMRATVAIACNKGLAGFLL